MALLAQVVLYSIFSWKEWLYCIVAIIQRYSTLLLKAGGQDEVCNLNWEGIYCYLDDDYE